MANDSTDMGTTGTTGTGGMSTEETKDRVNAAATEVRGALDSVGRQVPEVARSTRGVLDDAMRRIEMSSDERVSTGVTLSLGLAIGMLVGGAPRVLTALALVPVAAMGMVMMDRRARTNGSSGSSTARSRA